jgi:hypothetical protein
VCDPTLLFWRNGLSCHKCTPHLSDDVGISSISSLSEKSPVVSITESQRPSMLRLVLRMACASSASFGRSVKCLNTRKQRRKMSCNDLLSSWFSFSTSDSQRNVMFPVCLHRRLASANWDSNTYLSTHLFSFQPEYFAVIHHGEAFRVSVVGASLVQNTDECPAPDASRTMRKSTHHALHAVADLQIGLNMSLESTGSRKGGQR